MEFPESGLGPFVVMVVADHEFYLVFGGKPGEIPVAVFSDLPGTGCLEIHNDGDAFIDSGYVQCSTGFQGYLITRITQTGDEPVTSRLHERFAAGNRNKMGFVDIDLRQYPIGGHPLPAVEGIPSIAVDAP